MTLLFGGVLRLFMIFSEALQLGKRSQAHSPINIFSPIHPL